MATLLSDIIGSSSAFSPGHVTGIFAPAGSEETDILAKGSIGAGFSISRGVTSTASAYEAKLKGFSVSLNGIRVLNTPVSSYIAEYYLSLTDKPIFLQINHVAELPIGFGLGSSGAIALSLSYALNDLLKVGLSKIQAAQVAHCAETLCKTGLGTVAALYVGGYEIRLKPGAPGRGLIFRRELENHVATILCISPLSTKNMLNKLKSIDRIDEFLDASLSLASILGLTDGLCNGPIKALKSEGFKSSVALFGETVFTINPLERAEKVRTCLNKFGGTIIEANVESTGARMICECKNAS
jgi:pantoate kinase